MAMYQTYAGNEYRKSQVLTASRGQLLLMAYDGALRFLRLASSAMEQKSFEEQNTNITKAQAIILELLNSLDHTVNAQLADALDRLYRYMYDQLIEANVHDKLESLREVERQLLDLRETWAEAELQLAQG